MDTLGSDEWILGNAVFIRIVGMGLSAVARPTLVQESVADVCRQPDHDHFYFGACSSVVRPVLWLRLRDAIALDMSDFQRLKIFFLRR